MPVDKFGIPFWYPTKTTAGVSGTGSGFFWEQNNNFRVDENAGFLRLGKETDDCELIDLATGTWEFPFLADGDGLSVSGPTGHHSGGETHGCQGFTYMVDGDFESSPPTFRFRKETYHIRYDTDPQTGIWTSSNVTTPITNTWKGIGWVRYNKKGGRLDGGDSVVCECWWNDNPVANITNWVMIKRTEDRGEGISDWGIDSSTCDGVPFQVGTWSNIQFRWKSSASDFSLHPLIPEFNEGDNIHSIGGEDMSFSDSEARGYGKRADMPRDIEMKGLFKWDAGGNGKCHFKNLSLREIDPTLSFDDTPTVPPDPPGGSTSEIQGTFKFQWDINQQRTSACQGTGTGGGGGTGNTIFYTKAVDSDKELSNSSTWQNRTRIVMSPANSSSIFVGKKPIQFDIPLKKVGTPSSTPTIHAKIWSSTGIVLYDSPTTFAPDGLTTSYVKKVFDFSTNTRTLVTGDRIGVEWTGTSSSNYVVASYSGTSTANTNYYQYENGSWDFKTRSLSCDIWE